MVRSVGGVDSLQIMMTPRIIISCYSSTQNITAAPITSLAAAVPSALREVSFQGMTNIGRT